VSLCLALSVTAVPGQRSKTSPPSSPSNFLLNETRPYVYLELDHIGPREPTSPDEPHSGLWFRLHNNCIVPIIVNTFDAAPNSHPNEIGIFDNVVKNPDPTLGDGEVTAVSMPPEMSQETLAGILGTSASHPVPNEPALAKESQVDKMPHGYTFPVSSFMTIEPGQAVYFSVPLNHVNEMWHLEIPFRFAVKREGPVRWPKSYIAFYWEDLPKAYRTHSALP
jgi:hypothetical protein